MIHYVGLDVHRDKIVACIKDHIGKTISRHTIASERAAITAFAEKHLTAQDKVALEATFNSWAIRDVLAPLVAEVVVSNPLQTKAIAMAKVKTDKVDAEVLADLLRCDYLPQVWAPDEATRQMRRMQAHRAALIAERTRIKNRIHSVLARDLIPGFGGDLFSKKGQAWLAALSLAELSRRTIESELRLLQVVQAEIAQVDDTLMRRAFEDPQVKLLMTLPGVDYSVAQALLAALGDITRFRDGDHAAGYLGVVPSVHQSGAHCYLGSITKQGNGKARWMLVQAAQCLAMHPGPLGAFFRRIARKKNRNVAVVAVARKLVVIAWHMLTTNEPYRYALPMPTQNKLSRLRVRATGKKRQGGTKKGQKRSEHWGTGQTMRRIPALPTVLAEEGLPAATPPDKLACGERRVLIATRTADFVDQIQSDQSVVRKRKEPGIEACVA